MGYWEDDKTYVEIPHKCMKKVKAEKVELCCLNCFHYLKKSCIYGKLSNPKNGCSRFKPSTPEIKKSCSNCSEFIPLPSEKDHCRHHYYECFNQSMFKPIKKVKAGKVGNKCIHCGREIGNDVFTCCDDCWYKYPPYKNMKPSTPKPEGIEVEIRHGVSEDILTGLKTTYIEIVDESDLEEIIPKGQTAKFILTKKEGL